MSEYFPGQPSWQEYEQKKREKERIETIRQLSDRAWSFAKNSILVNALLNVAKRWGEKGFFGMTREEYYDLIEEYHKEHPPYTYPAMSEEEYQELIERYKEERMEYAKTVPPEKRIAMF